MKIILIAGKASSGKTSLGCEIVNLAKSLNLRALQTEFSKYIKMYAKEIIGYDGDPNNKPRKFLQDMGSFIRNDLEDEKFFVRRMLEDLKVYESYFDIVVISDVRLIQEIEEMKKSKYNVMSICVKNLNDNNLNEEEKNHITEIELDGYDEFDYMINNNKEEDLVIFATQIVEQINETILNRNKEFSEIEYTLSNEDQDIVDSFAKQDKKRSEIE